MHRVERLSIREISKRTGLHRKTIRRALGAEVPPTYSRPAGVSKLDPFREWICEQLQGDPGIQSLRLREMACELGYAGGKTIFDDYVREVRPRFLVKRTFQRTVYRPGELVQCDLWEPREPVSVGHAQTRRGWVVTAELCWSRVISGALIFSKEAPDILWGLGRGLERIGALPEKLVWDREGAIAPAGRPTDAFAGFCGQLGVGWGILDAVTRRPRACSSARTASCAPTSSPAGASPTRWTSSCSSTAGATGSTGGCIARSAPSPPSGWCRSRDGCGRWRPRCPTATVARSCGFPSSRI